MFSLFGTTGSKFLRTDHFLFDKDGIGDRSSRAVVVLYGFSFMEFIIGYHGCHSTLRQALSYTLVTSLS
jgi:hypothetical protein